MVRSLQSPAERSHIVGDNVNCIGRYGPRPLLALTPFKARRAARFSTYGHDVPLAHVIVGKRREPAVADLAHLLDGQDRLQTFKSCQKEALYVTVLRVWAKVASGTKQVSIAIVLHDNH